MVADEVKMEGSLSYLWIPVQVPRRFGPPSVAINGNQWQSVAISGNQWQSVAISGNQAQSPVHVSKRLTQHERVHVGEHKLESPA